MRIRYVGISDTQTRLTLHEFLQFGVKVRAVLVCEELVSFFDHRGRPIRTRDALIELRSTWSDEADVPIDLDDDALPQRREDMPNVEPDDRRQYERHDMVVPVSIRCEASADVAFTENISRGGMLFRSSRPFVAGETVEVQIPLAGTTDAVVIRSWARERDEHVTAIAFQRAFVQAA